MSKQSCDSVDVHLVLNGKWVKALSDVGRYIRLAKVASGRQTGVYNSSRIPSYVERIVEA